MVDRDDDWLDDECIQTHADSFSIHEVCFDILLECRRYREVGARDKGEEFDQFINDFGYMLKAFDKKQSSRGCRVTVPWCSRDPEFDVIHPKRQPVVRVRAARKMICDEKNIMFQDPNTVMSLELMAVASYFGKQSTYRKPRLHDHGGDVFARLPEELRTEILTWLPNDDVAALRLASRTMSGMKLSAAFWYSRLNAPELQMVDRRHMKKIGAMTEHKEDVIYSTLRMGLLRTRIARMAYEALWYVKVRTTAREQRIERPDWRCGSQRGNSQTAYSGLQTERINFKPHWFSAVRFDHQAPFQSFKKMTMFFHSPRRYHHHSEIIDREVDHDRHLTGIRFENTTHSKGLGHCRGQDTMQVVISDTEWFDRITLRIDTNNGVSVQSVTSTDGNVRREHDIYWSNLPRPFRARFEKMSFSECQEIEIGLTEEGLVVVFDVLISDPDSSTTKTRRRRRLGEYLPQQVKRLFRSERR